jgi:hypothetical protein
MVRSLQVLLVGNGCISVNASTGKLVSSGGCAACCCCYSTGNMYEAHIQEGCCACTAGHFCICL